MSISEQVNKLREAVKSYRPYVPYYVIGLLHNAADTIESLFAKLQAKEYCDGCPGADIIEIPCTEECKRRHFKAENMQRPAEDCGGGWIECENKMPEIGKPVLVCDKQGNVCVRAITCEIKGKKYWSQDKYDVVAWQPLPGPYHEP